jgi:hypothetical protein
MRSAFLLLLLLSAAAATKASAALKPMAETVKGYERRDGLIPAYLDETGGRILLLLPKPGADGRIGDYLYQCYIRDGLGSTPVALDRSAPADTQVISFRRSGHRVYAELLPERFRATGGSPDEKRAVAESFARSVIWAADITAIGSAGEILVDATDLLSRDGFGIIDRLKETKQGHFAQNRALSYVDVATAAIFPENDEFDAVQTFTSDNPGPEIEGLAADGKTITLATHTSFIKLPDAGFTPRLFDPRVNVSSVLVADYGSKLAEPVVTRLAQRWRLEKRDPASARSPVKKPILFYVDRAAPEPVRSALQEGAAWWRAAFEAAGFIDAFEVRILPEGVSPLDARYSVINWVHRQTRGWSYGQGVVDPRTGEIVRGSVLLGSLRVRQDRMIFEGLVGTALTGSGSANDPVQVSLARLRQLAVHEVGHALGIEHNMAGSASGRRASVMDYPAPRIKIVEGGLDLSDAYGTGVGAWDMHSILWQYGEPMPGTVLAAFLDSIAADRQGLKFVADSDSRPAGGAHPAGALWDDGADRVAELRHVMAVRRIALDHFGLRNLPAAAPTADLQRVLVPIYLLHRYEVDAAAKSIGGVDFGYPVTGDGQESAHLVAPEVQRAAIQTLLQTLDPAELDLPDGLLDLLSAQQSGVADKQFTVEIFQGASGAQFDLSAAARVAADLTIANLLHPARLNRLVESHRRDALAPGVAELVDALIGATFAAKPDRPHRQHEIVRLVQARVIAQLAVAQANPALAASAAGLIADRLHRLALRLQTDQAPDDEDRAQNGYLAKLLLDQDETARQRLLDAGRSAPPAPPGMPIGGGGEDCWYCTL